MRKVFFCLYYHTARARIAPSPEAAPPNSRHQTPRTNDDARRRKDAACPHGHKAEDADRWGKQKLDSRPGNGAPLCARATSFSLPCERGLNSHTDVVTRPRLSLALWLLGISGRSSRYWPREHKILSYTAQYTKVYETGPSSRVVREAALGRRGWGSTLPWKWGANIDKIDFFRVCVIWPQKHKKKRFFTKARSQRARCLVYRRPQGIYADLTSNLQREQTTGNPPFCFPSVISPI